MKPIALSSLLLLIALNLYGQENVFSKFDKNLSISFSYNHEGKSLILDYQKYKNQHSFYGGVKLFLNNSNRWKEINNYAFLQNGYASDFGKSIGLNSGYNYNYHFKDNDFVIGYFFFDIEYSHLRFKSLGDRIEYVDSAGVQRGYDVIHTTSAGHLFDNTIGLGFKFRFSEIVNMNIQSGIGATLYYFPNGIETYDHSSYLTSEGIAPFVRIGIGYSFHKK